MSNFQVIFHPPISSYDEWRWDEMVRRVRTINAKTTQVNLVFNARLDENHRQQKIAPKKCASVRAFFCVWRNFLKQEKKKEWCVSVIMHHALVDAFETGGKPKCHKKKVCDFNGPALSRWMEPLLWFYGWNAPEISLPLLWRTLLRTSFMKKKDEENAEKKHH